MTHAVFQPSALAATDVNSYNRNAVTATDDIDNGWLVKLTTLSATAGESQVFTAVVPSTGNGLTDLWMAYSGDEVVLTASKYKGLDPDPRNFVNVGGKTFSVFKPQIGDIYVVTADGISTNVAIGANTFVNATDTTGGYKPVWGATQTASVFSAKLLETTYVSIPDGTISGTGRVTAYKFQVVGL
jgi:hypothetical protein